MNFWSYFKEACLEIADDILNVLEMSDNNDKKF